MSYTATAHTIEHYQTTDGNDVLAAWFATLRNRRAVARIAARVGRLAHGLFGDGKSLRDGVWELRIDEGLGYRVYYSRAGHRSILLLCGGDKSTQTKDIQSAVDYWEDWQERTRHEKSTRKPPSRRVVT